MLNFFHTHLPQAVIFQLGPISLRWYGLIMAIAIAAALLLTLALAKKKNVPQEQIVDAAFWTIIGGVIGARIYEIFLEWPYYITNPDHMIRIWEGGLAIHGAIIGGAITLLIFFRKKRRVLLPTTGLFLPGLALGQAIGRWGNYFNQELFGRPTNLPWGIPISPANRPESFLSYSHFHPTFLYESLLNLALAIFLWNYVKQKTWRPAWAIGLYMLSYGVIRFGLEFIKIDRTPVLVGLRWPQIISLLMAVIGFLLISFSHAKPQKHS